MPPFTSILCAADSSPLAARVLRHALGVAGVCGARLTILTVARGDLLQVEAGLAAQVRAKHGDELFAEASTRLVRLDPQAQTPCPWSERMRLRMGPLVAPAPATATPRSR